MVSDVTRETLQGVVREEVTREARLMTGGLQSYVGLAKDFAGHESVDHSAEDYARGDAHVNTAESYFSLFKRGVIGTFHHVSKKHMRRYLAEFDFRWNRRKVEDCERLVSAVHDSRGKRLYYRTPKAARV